MTKYDTNYWQRKLSELQNHIFLPDIFSGGGGNDPAFAHAVTGVDAARDTLQACTILRDQLAKQPNVDANILKQATAAVATAMTSLQEADATAMAVARTVLQKLERDGFLSPTTTNAEPFYYLLAWTCITMATPEYLGQYCRDNGPDKAEALVLLFQQPRRLVPFLQHGAPSHGRFGQALDLYTQLSSSFDGNDASDDDDDDDDDPLMRRLALAIALELAAPEDKMVVHPDRTIDPMQRFIHYQQAYLLGELDPAFEQLTVWELRMAVDSDATEEELGWGRASLKNHRPDLVVMDDSQWRYCRIVRTDVSYNDPVFYKEPHSYDQILSGGGKCGPRAWYGRFACKAFGCPTWGVTQPGHAAMSRWTRDNGWVICLGAGFQVSFWLDRCGNDFLLETQARSAIGTDEDYMVLVSRLEWAALFAGEKEGLERLRKKGETDIKFLWTALSYYQRRLWAASRPPAKIARDIIAPSQPNQIHQLMIADVSFSTIRRECNKAGDSILIPAESFSDHLSGVAIVMKSFLGGQQLWLGPAAEVSYTLEKSVVGEERTNYKVFLFFNTVHRDEPPLLMTVSESGGDDSPTMVSQISISYTMGLWEQSGSVEIEIGGPGIDYAQLSLTRQAEQFGIAIKRIQLVPIDQLYSII